MNAVQTLFVLIIINAVLVKCDPLFFRGRPWGKYGMQGSPGGLRGRLQAIEPQWMQQRLNHFDPSDTRVWKQRYFVSDKYFKEGGPVFLQLGGEGTADPVWLSEGQVATNYGSKLKALLILLEHRYYGESHPTKDLSTRNLKYLTSEQALADAATFINYYKTINPSTISSKWVVFGGSYSGSLSAWMRSKYPHLVTGAVASSAPMKAVINFKDYLSVVRDSLGNTCDASIQQATDELSALLKKPSGWEEINKQFNLCDPLNANRKNDVMNLMSTLAGNFEGVVQYNKDNRAFEKAVGTNITIDTICGIMTDSKNGDSVSRYASVNKLILDTYGQKCLDYRYNNFIKNIQKVNWNESASEGGRQWTYQTCVEFGFYQSSDLTQQPFGHYFPVEFFVKQCRDIFGKDFSLELLERGVNYTNTNYGAYGIQVSNVVLPNGSIDPWHALGLRDYHFANSKSVFINGTAHCADTYPDSTDDSKELIAARAEIGAFIESIVK